MPSSDVAPLRIYCVCGQKMKVSEDMYGRPGKCVACRQKIRIPRPDEIPPNTEVLYLKDHPEFLRKVKSGPRRQEKEEVEVAPLPDIDPKGKVRRAHGPLDVLEPLRLIHSLLAKIEKQLSAANADNADGGKPTKKVAELQGIRTKIREAQQDLEEELRQRLMETAIELAATQEKIAELNLAVRVGEISFDDYRAQVDRLRRRRDNHERRQSNLRGWLTVDDVHRAGGYTDVSLESIPKGPFRVVFAGEIDDNATLLDAHIESLRHALERRAISERKLSEAKRTRSGDSTAGSLHDIVADARAEHERSQAQVQHARERLEQLADDYTNDVHAVEAHLDHVRGRLQVGQLNRAAFNDAEEKLLRAKTDFVKARSLVVRALNANSTDEVPRPRGTFIARLAHGRPGFRAPNDAWLAWAGAAMLLGSLFLPLGDSRTALQLMRADAGGGGGVLLTVVPIALAVVSAASALVPTAAVRGFVYCAIFLLAVLFSTAFFHESRFALGVVPEALRSGGAMLLRPAVLVYAVGLLAVFTGAVIALIPTREGRIVLPLTALAVLAGVGAILTDFAGARTVRPVVNVESRSITDADPPVHEVVVTIANEGERELVLAAGSTAENAYAMTVEKRIGRNSGIDVSAPVAVRSGMVAVPTGSPLPYIPVTKASPAQFTYRLPEGDYRVVLQGARENDRIERSFTLEPIVEYGSAPVDSAPAVPSVQSEPPSPHSAPPASRTMLMEALSAEVTLTGILAAGDRPARFSIRLVLPDGATSERTYGLGDDVFNGWKINEFNPDEQTVTLVKGRRILIVRRGEPQHLTPRE